jgi:hypothetical protein
MLVPKIRLNIRLAYALLDSSILTLHNCDSCGSLLPVLSYSMMATHPNHLLGFCQQENIRTVRLCPFVC